MSVTTVRTEMYGEYVCLIAETDDIDMIDELEGTNRSLSAAMKIAARIAAHKEKEAYKGYASQFFPSEVDEKNYLQQSMAVGGHDLIYEVMRYLDDYLATAFCRAAAKYRWESIPSASEIFQMREKLYRRKNRNLW